MRPELRDEWDAAGYGRKMGSACVVPPPPNGILRVYHLTSAEFAINDIALGRMKVARFSDLNDPFELKALNFGGKIGRRAAEKFRTDYDKHTGLLCFSRNWTNPVLWSHYGAKHRGICLGFNIQKRLLEKVQYKDQRPLRDLDDADPNQMTNHELDLLCRTKYKHWNYEEELRYFVSLDESIQEARLYFREFGNSIALIEVILGYQCELSLDVVRRLTEAHCQDATTFKARLAFKTFDVVPDGTTVP